MSGRNQRNIEATHPATVDDSLGQSFLNGAESALAVQSDWLAAYETIVTGWVHRRRAALQATMNACEQAPGCRATADWLALQQRWIAGSLQRLADDFTAWNETTALLSRLAMKHLEQVSRGVTASGQAMHRG